MDGRCGLGDGSVGDQEQPTCVWGGLGELRKAHKYEMLTVGDKIQQQFVVTLASPNACPRKCWFSIHRCKVNEGGPWGVQGS